MGAQKVPHRGSLVAKQHIPLEVTAIEKLIRFQSLPLAIAMIPIRSLPFP
jgi:hypothetical protein